MNPPQPPTPACPQSIEELDRFVSGELSGGDASSFEHHVTSCAACASLVEDRRRIRAAVRSAVMADEDPPAELLGLLRERLQKESTQRPRRATWQPFAMAAGIVLAATGAVMVAWLVMGTGSITSEPGRAALRLTADADHHGKCVQEMAGRMPSPTSNGGSLDADVTVVEAIVREQAIVGTTVAAAHRCTDGKRRYVHVVLEREGALAGVLVSDADDGREGDADGLPVVATARAATFTAGGKVVSVVSDSPSIDASRFAERLQPSMTGL